MLEKEVFELAKVNSGADDSEEVWDNASPQDECVGEKDFDFNGNTFCEDARVLEVEGSSSGNDHTCGSEHPESSHSNRKRKISEFNDEETSSYSKCNDKLRKSSPVQLVVENICEDSQWKTNEGSRTKVDCSVPKDLVTSELIGSSSEGRSLAVDVGSGSVDRAEGSKRAKTGGEFDSDVSVSPSRMDVDSLSPSIRRNVDTSPCKFCEKLQR